MRIALPGIIKSEDVVAQFEGQKHLLAFSCGKDAIAAWIAIRGKVEIIPFFMELIPGLGFVEASLDYYERFFGQKILRVPNPSLYRMLDRCIFTPPDQMHQIDRWGGLPQFDHLTLRDFIATSHGIKPHKTWTASGVRAADSIIRRVHFQKHGPIVHNTRTFYPVWDWSMDCLVSALRSVKVKLPVDYRIFGRSFDGLDFRFIAPIKKHFPRDYAKILEWFPMAGLELKRHEFSESYAA